MTTSPEPWTLGPGNQILDRLGNPVAVFRDGRDADRCLSLMTKIDKLSKMKPRMVYGLSGFPVEEIQEILK